MKRLVHDVIHVLKASLYFILQVVIPPIHNRACYYSTPDYTDNAYYLYRYALKERNGIEHVWLVDDITNAARIQEEFDALDVSGKQHSIIIKKRKSVSGAWCALRSRWFFYTHNVFRFARTGYRRALVNLWHGMPIKKIGSFDASAPDVRLAYGTHYIATTWFFRYLVACAFNAAYDRIIVAQQPRCDVLCGWQPPQSSKQIILQKMGISGDKVILWAPTFRQMSKVKTSDRSRSFLDDVPEELLKVIDQYAKLKKIVVGEEALKVFRKESPDLIILDIMLPKIGGYEVCKELRKGSSVPIIMLTALGDISDRVMGLEFGADDYVLKPFSPKELEARVRSVLRRIKKPPEAKILHENQLLQIGNLIIDTKKRQVLKGSKRIRLTAMEFNLLELLINQAGERLSRSYILDSVWGYTPQRYVDTRVVDVHISRLRAKLEEDPSNPDLILTARGTGYMFQNFYPGVR